MSEPYDAIVIGAGAAGLCCAGELVRLGARPLLICETNEVAFNYRSVWVGRHRGVSQAATLQHTSSGGWWFPLTRALNVPVTLHPPTPIKAAVWGSTDMFDVPMAWTSAAALTQGLLDLSGLLAPEPIDAFRNDIEKLATAALAGPWDQLASDEMHRLPLAEWMRDQGATEIASMLFLVLIGLLTEVPLPLVAEHVSVFGGLGLVRSILCGEGLIPVCYPDPREGLWIPLAQAIEQRGGTILRGRRVARVITNGETASAVVLADGTELHAPQIAIATGNTRIPALFDHVPPEIATPLSSRLGEHKFNDYNTFAVIDRPVIPAGFRHYLAVVSPAEGWSQWIWPAHALAPWDGEPGQQMLISHRCFSTSEASAAGPDVPYQQMDEVTDFYFPGYLDAKIDAKHLTHAYQWYSHCLTDTHLPRRSTSIDRLWFVGDSSLPCHGIYGEAAASTGILGARAILGLPEAAPRRGSDD